MEKYETTERLEVHKSPILAVCQISRVSKLYLKQIMKKRFYNRCSKHSEPSENYLKIFDLKSNNLFFLFILKTQFSSLVTRQIGSDR